MRVDVSGGIVQGSQSTWISQLTWAKRCVAQAPEKSRWTGTAPKPPPRNLSEPKRLSPGNREETREGTKYLQAYLKRVKGKLTQFCSTAQPKASRSALSTRNSRRTREYLGRNKRPSGLLRCSQRDGAVVPCGCSACSSMLRRGTHRLRQGRAIHNLYCESPISDSSCRCSTDGVVLWRGSVSSTSSCSRLEMTWPSSSIGC